MAPVPIVSRPCSLQILLAREIAGKVVHPAVRPEDAEGLVLGPAVARLDWPALPLRLDDALAAHGAGIAGVAVGQDRGGHRLTGDRLVAVELAGVVVEGRQGAGSVLPFQDAGGPVRAQAQDIGIVRDLRRACARQLVEDRRVRQGELLAGPAGDDRLQVLRAHHRAHPGAAVGTVGHVHDRGKTDELLAGRPRLGYLNLVVAEVALEDVVDLGRRLPPQVAGGPQLRHTVVQPQVSGFGGAAPDHDPGEAGEAQLGGEEAPGLAVADAVRERRASVDGDPALARDGRPRQEAVHERQHVVRIEAVGAGLPPLEDVVQPHGGAAEVLPVERLGGTLDLQLARREVDVEDAPGEVAWHSPLSDRSTRLRGQPSIPAHLRPPAARTQLGAGSGATPCVRT